MSVLIVCALAGLAVNSLIAFANSSAWSADFHQFYSAGKLVGTGRLYDWPSISRMERERGTCAGPFIRMPVFAAAFKPLSALPYPAARAVWLCVGIAALAGFVWLWPSASRPWVCVAVLCSQPVALCLSFGQDSILFLFFATLGVRLLIDERHFAAGLAFSVCSAKPHLALLLPVLLVARRKWTALWGGLSGGMALVALSFAVEGRDWLARLLALAPIPEFDPAPIRMPNTRGLLVLTGGGLALEVALGLLAVGVFWWISRSQPLPAAAALALAGGLMIGHHGYAYDACLLLPALILPWQGEDYEPIRWWALLLLTPAPYLFLLLDQAGIIGHIAITGYTLALLAFALWRVARHPQVERALA